MRRPARSSRLIAAVLTVVALMATLFALGSPPAASAAEPVTPTGPVTLELLTGSLDVKTQHFDLTPSELPACSDGVDNNDAPDPQHSDGLIDYPADPECSSPLDNSELAPGFQPKEDVVVVGTIDSAGTFLVPKNVRASETEARNLGGLYFPPGYVPDATLGMITAKFQPVGSGNFSGTFNMDTGAVTLPLDVRIKLEGGSGLTALGSSCYIPGSGSMALNFSTGTTAPPLPNLPITGDPYDKRSGDFRVVNNAFAVPGAGGCGLLGLANGSINDAFGLPSNAGNNTANFTFTATPTLNRLEWPVEADAGADQTIHIQQSVVQLDGSKSREYNRDQSITSYSWVQTSGPAVTLSDPTVAKPTFTKPLPPAALTFDLTVTSSDTTVDTDSVTINVLENIPPVANAGPDRNAPSGVVELDGTASSDGDDNPLTYSWVQTAGTPVTLDDATAAKPKFTLAGPDVVTFDLTVNDGFGGTNTDSVTITVDPNQAPTANAGPDQTNRKSAQTVTLDASGSTDPDGAAQTLTYQWSQVSGWPATISDTTAQKPTFVVPAAPDFVYPHNLVFQVVVNDGFGGTDVDTVSIEVTATPVAISAVTRTPSGTVFSGDTVTLAGTITNPDGYALGYAWTQASGRTTSLSANNVANPTFIVPANGTDAGACTSGTTTPVSPTNNNCPRYNLAITNTTNGLGSGNATLGAFAASAPARPLANAGASQYVKINGGTVTLSGSGTQTQGHSLTYQWTQTAGDPVTLSDPTSASPTFTAPGTVQNLTFSLTVTDPQNPILTGTNSKTSLASTTTVRVVPDVVVADAGPDQVNKLAGQTVTLDASLSTEPDHLPLSYSWTQLSGPTVTINNPNTVNPTFVAPPVDNPAGYTVVLQVTATNGGANPGDTSTDTVSIGVVRSTPTVSVARAPSGTVFTGDTVTLTANITNPDGTNPADYTYTWSQATGRTTSLSSTTAEHPTFVVPTSGSSSTTACSSGTGATSPTSANCPRFQVTVTNTKTGASSTVSALAAYGSSLPGRPTANAGTNQSVQELSTVTLHGSGTQAQSRPLNYQWTQTGGPAVTLSSSTVAEPTFTAPVAPATLTFSLVTIDPLNPVTSGSNQNTSTAATTTVNVNAGDPPVTNAGPDQLVQSGDLVELDGSASDVDNLPATYAWSQVAGPAVTLSDDSSVTPTFTAPTGPATLTFELSVTTLRGTTTDQVDIVVNGAPVADAGPDQTVDSVSSVQLDGSASSDPDNDVITYLWTQTGGPAVTLSDATSATPTFTAPVGPATVTFDLTVTDETGATGTDSVSVSVNAPVIDVSGTAFVKGEINTAKPVSKFYVYVKNELSTPITVSGASVSASITVNGVPVSPGDITVVRPPEKVIRGHKTGKFAVEWNNGGTPRIGDTIVITGCVSQPGDQNPTNDCASISRPDGAFDFSTQVQTSVFDSRKTSAKAAVLVTNNGFTAGAIRAENITVTVKVNGEDTAIPVTLASPDRARFVKFGRTIKFSYVIDYGALNPGDEVEITSCVNVPGNVNAADGCSTSTQFVV